MSRKRAIDDKCRDCICDPLAGGTWREQVKRCVFTECSLYPYRPIPKVSNPTKAYVSKAKLEQMAKMRAARGKKDVH